MAEAAKAERVTVVNQKEGRFVLPPDPDELKKNPKAKNREILSGRSLEVSAEEAAKLLQHRGLVDAATIVGRTSSAAEIADLKKQLAAAKAENEKLSSKPAKKAKDAE